MPRVRQAEEVVAAFASKLRALAEERHPGRGGSRKVAEELNIRPQQWSQWTQGKSYPLREQRAKIAKYFGIDEADLLPGTFEKAIAQEKTQQYQEPMLQATTDFKSLMGVLCNLHLNTLKGDIAVDKFAATIADTLRYVKFALYEMDVNPDKEHAQGDRAV